MLASHDEHRRRQDEILERTLEILNSDKRVLGIIVTGSVAEMCHDAFSDIDLVCYLRDERRVARQELYNKVGEIAPLMCKMWLHDKNAFYLFLNGVRLDLDFNKPSHMSEAWPVTSADRKILYDPDGAMAHELNPLNAPIPAPVPRGWQPNQQDYLDYFFWLFRAAYCWIKRGAQGGPKTFDKLHRAAKVITEIREDLISIKLWTYGSEDYLSKIDPDCAARMASTFTRMQPDEMLHTTRLLLTEFEEICSLFCQKAGITYPVQKVDIMKQLMNEFDQLK